MNTKTNIKMPCITAGLIIKVSWLEFWNFYVPSLIGLDIIQKTIKLGERMTHKPKTCRCKSTWCVVIGMGNLEEVIYKL